MADGDNEATNTPKESTDSAKDAAKEAAKGTLTDVAMDHACSGPYVSRDMSIKEKAQALTSVISTTEGPPSIGTLMDIIKLPEGASVSVFLIEFCSLYVWH